jgi:hypothetical protein
MGNYHDTLLECKSNNQLLQKIDPRDIIKKSESQFMSCKDGIYYFQTHRGALHEDIVELSKEYPEEVFSARIWNVDFYDSIIRALEYKDGDVKILSSKPNYSYCAVHLIKAMGEENFEKLMNVAMKYIESREKVKDDPEYQSQITKNNRDKIYSYINVHVEDDKYKLEATIRTTSYIHLVGYVKEVPTKPIWRLIEEENCSNKRNDKKRNKYGFEEVPESDYDEVPF